MLPLYTTSSNHITFVHTCVQGRRRSTDDFEQAEAPEQAVAEHMTMRGAEVAMARQAGMMAAANAGAAGPSGPPGRQARTPLSNAAGRSNSLVASGTTGTPKSTKMKEIFSNNFTCPICCEWLLASHTLSCGHMFCGLCLATWLSQSQSCPSCRKPVAGLWHVHDWLAVLQPRLTDHWCFCFVMECCCLMTWDN